MKYHSYNSKNKPVVLTQEQADLRTACANAVGYVLRECTLATDKNFMCWERDDTSGKLYFGKSHSPYHCVYESRGTFMWPEDAIKDAEKKERKDEEKSKRNPYRDKRGDNSPLKFR